MSQVTDRQKRSFNLGKHSKHRCFYLAQELINVTMVLGNAFNECIKLLNKGLNLNAGFVKDIDERKKTTHVLTGLIESQGPWQRI